MDIKLIADLRYLRAYYGWIDEDASDVMQSIKENPDAARYYIILSAAHRAGYEQTAENNFIRLQIWCGDKGLPDPFGPAFDVAALDALAIETRRAT